MKSKVLAIIPARGGSKSIPRKNLIKIIDKPLIAWTIDIAKSCKNIDRVIVSTDDQEIAQVSRSYGAEVPFIRPHKYATDVSRDIEYHLHALNWLKQNESYEPDALVNLRPTTPLRDPNIIDNAIKIFFENPNYDSLRSVQIAKENPFKMWTIENKSLKQIAFIENIKEPYNEPRQKLPFSYWQNGYIDIVKSSILKDQESTTGIKILPYIIENPSIDLDYPEEIKKAENQLNEKINNNRSLKNNENINITRFPS